MSERVTVVFFKYNTPGYRTRFTSHMVNSLYKQLADHTSVPWEPVCITDDPKGLMGDIFTRPLLPTFRNLRNPTSPSRPNCYVRLPLLDPTNPYRLNTEFFISVDLDALVVGPMDELIQHWQDFIVYKVRGHFCGSMFGGRVGGSASKLFSEFDPSASPRMTHEAGLRGSDQAWFEFKMPDAPTWEAKDGVLGWQDDIGHHFGHRRAPVARRRPQIHVPGAAGRVERVSRPQLPAVAAPTLRNPAVLPAHARIVHFYGSPKHWDPDCQRLSPWIKTHLR